VYGQRAGSGGFCTGFFISGLFVVGGRFDGGSDGGFDSGFNGGFDSRFNSGLFVVSGGVGFRRWLGGWAAEF
jgi:hypothetical protein